MTTTITAAIHRFAAAEAGAVTVDWAMLAAGVTGLALSAIAILEVTTNDFSDRLATDLTDGVRDVQVLSADGTALSLAAASLAGPTDDPLYDAWSNLSAAQGGLSVASSFAAMQSVAFAGRSTETSTTISRVSCGTLAGDCGRSGETLTESFLMTDGSIWQRTTTTYLADESQAVVWYDGTGRETTQVPDLPDTLPDVVIQ